MSALVQTYRVVGAEMAKTKGDKGHLTVTSSMSKSLGEADGSTQSDGKDSSVKLEKECPTCGRDDFKTHRGMKSHHKHVHGESIAGIEVSCHECGKIHRKKPNRVKDKNYCSKECQYTDWGSKLERREWRDCSHCGGEFETTPASSKKYCSRDCYHQNIGTSGPENGNWKGDELVGSCEVCGETYRESSKKRAEDRRFCSKKCAGASRQNKVALTCKWCKEEYQTWPSVSDGSSFCSRECKNKWQKEGFVGEKNPHWTGGYDSNYGPNWEEKRTEAIVRDQCRCQCCRKTPIDVGRELDVHHIVRINDFDKSKENWYKKANSLRNLITLCRQCHFDWEGIPLRPQVK